MSGKRTLLSIGLVFATASGASAQAASAPVPASSAKDATLVFHFERTGLPVPAYTFTLHENGSGTYAATYLGRSQASKYGGSATPPGPVTEVTRDFTVTPATTARLFEKVRGTNHFHAPCASTAKNIADTGTKTLTYAGPDGTASCTYNYTENKPVSAVTEAIQGIAQTLDEGRTIEQLHRFDRLGLDREMTLLVTAIQDGTALEPLVIAPTLRSLCEDSQVMDRVRVRAARLLETNGSR